MNNPTPGNTDLEAAEAQDDLREIQTADDINEPDAEADDLKITEDAAELTDDSVDEGNDE